MTSKIADGKSWKDIPTCKSQGLDIEYLMLRGIFMSPRATKDQVEYYIELFKKVRATPEWQDFMKSGAFNTTFMTGRRLRQVGRGRGKASRGPDEGRRFPRRARKLID